MSGMQSRKRASDFQSLFSGKSTRSSILEIDCWMQSKVQAISPLIDRMMRLMEGSQCVAGGEFEIELALREALGNAVVHGNRQDPKTKVHVRCRCGPGREISIVVTDQGKGFDFEKVVGNGRSSRPATEHGHGIQLMKAYMDDVRFERGGSEVHMRKTRQARQERSASHQRSSFPPFASRSHDGPRLWAGDRDEPHGRD